METNRDLYVALALLAKRYRRVGTTPDDELAGDSLTAHELRVFSQNGEDGVLAEILTRIGGGDHFFVEFGVETGREGNCVYLADVAEWQGLFLEGDNDLFGLLALKYGANPRVALTQALVSPENVENLFESARVPPEPAVLSIDVDGVDYWIWDAINDYRPRVVVIEYNSSLDVHRQLVQPFESRNPWDGTAYFGASLGALRALGERKGYCLVHTELNGVNAFFVRNDLVGDKFPTGDAVAVRSIPNYFGGGVSHPPDPARRQYLDLETGLMT